MTESGGIYEARYHLTRQSLRPVAVCVVLLIPAMLPVPWPVVLVDVALVGPLVVLLLANPLSRRVALRVDSAGVTLGGAFPRFRASTAVIPWHDVRAVDLFELLSGRAPMPYIRILRCGGAPPLPGGISFGRFNQSLMGAEFASCRAISYWTLDVPRLRAVLENVAPGVPITGRLSERTSGLRLRRPGRLRDPRGRFIWRYMVPVGLSGLFVLSAWHLVPAWSAHLGHGRIGTWTVAQNDCTKNSCTTWGRFVSLDGADVREHVEMGRGAPPVSVAGTISAVDTGDHDHVYPLGGGSSWWLYTLIAVLATVLAMLWVWTVPVTLIRRRTRRMRA